VPSSQNETRNLGIAILVPLLALMATSAYVIYVPLTSTSDLVFGRIVAGVVLAFFIYNCVLSFQKGGDVSKGGDPSRGASPETRTGPIWGFVYALGVLGLIVSLSGPSNFIEVWQARLSGLSLPSLDSTVEPAPVEPAASTSDAASGPLPPAIGPDGLPIPNTPPDTSASKTKLTTYSALQLALTFVLAGVLIYFSIHISRLDNQITQRSTPLISHSIIYFVITFLNFLLIGSPLGFGFLSSSVPDTIFNLAFSLRFILLSLGAAVVAIDALRVFSGSYQAMRSIVEHYRFSLPARNSGARGLFSAIFLIVFLIGRVVLVTVNFFISVAVWICVLAYFFIASCVDVVRTAIFSWALGFALLHTIAFVFLALALLNAPWALTHIRTYFATGNDVALAAIGIAVAGILSTSVFMAVIAFASAHFSWPRAVFTAIPELIAYTLIAIWLNSVALHLAKGLFGIGPDNFGSFAKLGSTFYVGVIVGIAAFFVALYQSGKRKSPQPAPV